MTDSYKEAIIPIGADEILREKYINYNGECINCINFCDI
jgi:hypothetical protein